MVAVLHVLRQCVLDIDTWSPEERAHYQGQVKGDYLARPTMGSGVFFSFPTIPLGTLSIHAKKPCEFSAGQKIDQPIRSAKENRRDNLPTFVDKVGAHKAFGTVMKGKVRKKRATEGKALSVNGERFPIFEHSVHNCTFCRRSISCCSFDIVSPFNVLSSMRFLSLLLLSSSIHLFKQWPEPPCTLDMFS
jgi:hypothetical protein